MRFRHRTPGRGPEEAAMKTLDQLFNLLLQDVYYAEKALLRVLNKMAKQANDEKLQKAFTDHRKETELQVERLEQVFEMFDKKPRAKKCEAILGIIAEGDEMMEKAEDKDVLDAGLIAAAQAAEHYEISRYGTLAAWAAQLGNAQAARLLHETLEEEKRADALLSEIAESAVNRQAQAA
jgi:ferritin-like metal-binding protein YciE